MPTIDPTAYAWDSQATADSDETALCAMWRAVLDLFLNDAEVSDDE